ncbi:hypothetical protein BD626DRAFT_538862 [Schizophyllum amplum]|uniref:Uncharacterized protein n=1 Tax=Schizophyllum amplum TaxID=97359 RepID=A0A550C6R1_9AGAR|nr:hypothetical protein BD626DRAFT_538862 [Auriculariopsis ampla]
MPSSGTLVAGGHSSCSSDRRQRRPVSKVGLGRWGRGALDVSDWHHNAFRRRGDASGSWPSSTPAVRPGGLFVSLGCLLDSEKATGSLAGASGLHERRQCRVLGKHAENSRWPSQTRFRQSLCPYILHIQRPTDHEQLLIDIIVHGFLGNGRTPHIKREPQHGKHRRNGRQTRELALASEE